MRRGRRQTSLERPSAKPTTPEQCLSLSRMCSAESFPHFAWPAPVLVAACARPRHSFLSMHSQCRAAGSVQPPVSKHLGVRESFQQLVTTLSLLLITQWGDSGVQQSEHGDLRQNSRPHTTFTFHHPLTTRCPYSPILHSLPGQYDYAAVCGQFCGQSCVAGGGRKPRLSPAVGIFYSGFLPVLRCRGP